MVCSELSATFSGIISVDLSLQRKTFSATRGDGVGDLLKLALGEVVTSFCAEAHTLIQLGEAVVGLNIRSYLCLSLCVSLGMQFPLSFAEISF